MAPPKTLRIVLCEDDDVSASRLERNIGQRYEIFRVKSLAELLAIPAKFAVDVILLDLGLPDTMDLDRVKLVRDICEAYSRSAVIVLTGLDDHQLAFAARRAGAKDYIVKGLEVWKDIESKILFAHQIKQSELEVLHKAAESSAGMVDPTSIIRAVKETLEHELEQQHAAAIETEGPPTHWNRLKQWVASNIWRIGSVVFAAVVYLVEVRDQVRDFTEDVEEFQQSTSDMFKESAKAIERVEATQKEDSKELREAILRQQELSVKSTEQLQAEIRAANPRATPVPEDPVLKAAKEEVARRKAEADLFGKE